MFFFEPQIKELIGYMKQKNAEIMTQIKSSDDSEK